MEHDSSLAQGYNVTVQRYCLRLLPVPQFTMAWHLNGACMSPAQCMTPSPSDSRMWHPGCCSLQASRHPELPTTETELQAAPDLNRVACGVSHTDSVSALPPAAPYAACSVSAAPPAACCVRCAAPAASAGHMTAHVVRQWLHTCSSADSLGQRLSCTVWMHVDVGA